MRLGLATLALLVTATVCHPDELRPWGSGIRSIVVSHNTENRIYLMRFPHFTAPEWRYEVREIVTGLALGPSGLAVSDENTGMLYWCAGSTLYSASILSIAHRNPYVTSVGIHDSLGPRYFSGLAWQPHLGGPGNGGDVVASSANEGLYVIDPSTGSASFAVDSEFYDRPLWFPGRGIDGVWPGVNYASTVAVFTGLYDFVHHYPHVTSRRSTGPVFNPGWPFLAPETVEVTVNLYTGLAPSTLVSHDVNLPILVHSSVLGQLSVPHPFQVGGASEAAATSGKSFDRIWCDFDWDGLVNENDFSIFASAYESWWVSEESHDERWDWRCDLVYPFYVVDLDDYLFFASYYEG